MRGPGSPFARLARRAAARYVSGGRTAAGFAAGKLTSDPVYAAALCDGLLPPGGVFVDIGCGQGLMLALLVEARLEGRDAIPALPIFDRLVGIETRPGVARLAAGALGDDVEIVEGDAITSALPPCSAAVLFDVLHMMPRAQQDGLLAAVRAAIQPGGVLLVREADAGAGWRFALVRLGNRLKALLAGAWRQPLRYRHPDDWIASFRRAGFAAERCDRGSGGPLGNVLFRLTPAYTADVACMFPDAGFVRLPAGEDGAAAFRLDRESHCFDGHFDGAPVLPGVAHVALALSAGRESATPARALVGLRDLRFLQPLAPGDTVDVRLKPAADEMSARFEIRRHRELVSSGQLVFAPSDAVHT